MESGTYKELTPYAVESPEGDIFVRVLYGESGDSVWVSLFHGEVKEGIGIVLGTHVRPEGPCGGQCIEYLGGTERSPPSVIFSEKT